jgi:hypothetical protein
MIRGSQSRGTFPSIECQNGSMGIIAALALLLATRSAVAQPEATPCRFEDVVRAPDTAPAMRDPSTALRPEPSHFMAPPRDTTVKVWLRVSAEGQVTGACAPDAPEGLRQALVAAAKQLRYTPAQHRNRPVATVAAVSYPLAGRFHGRGVQEQVGASDDIPWLEQIANSAAFARGVWQTQRRPVGQPKDLRIVAYARLGELGTDDSVAAQQRVRAQFAARSVISDTVNLTESWPHPGWHMGDYDPVPLAQTQTSDGKRFVTFLADLLGAPQLFLVRCGGDNSRCARPKPFAAWPWQDVKVDASLEAVSAGHLRLNLRPVAPLQRSIMDGTGPVESVSRQTPKPESRDIDISDVERDSDSDGWTDIEEQTLGLDPARGDSDGDGIDDAHDRAPLYAPPRADAAAEETRILQAAVFAAFGLSESRWALFANGGQVRKLEVPGLAAPVLFNQPLRFDPTGGPGGVFVRWKIVRQSMTDATVEISDWEGPLAAGGQDIFLRRIKDQWIVIGRQTTWIS